MRTLIFFNVMLLSAAQCPNVIHRTEWGARPPAYYQKQQQPSIYYVIHHSATAGCDTRETCESRVRSFQKYHMDEKGWEDIGYNFLIGGNGEIFEGRGWGLVGAHAIGFNFNSMGICLIGNFETEEPTKEALDAAQTLMKTGVEMGRVVTNYTLIGHRQAKSTSTACPGEKLFAIVETWPNYKPGKQ